MLFFSSLRALKKIKLEKSDVDEETLFESSANG